MGRLARHFDGPIEATLRAPVPVGRALAIERHGEEVAIQAGDRPLATARAAAFALEPPPAPDFESARAAAGSSRAFLTHPFPGCFACGPERPPPDGLGVYPGVVKGTDRAAAPWCPERALAGAAGGVEPEFVGAALDCPSAFPLLESEEEARRLEPMVLGRLALEIRRAPRPGERCVVVAWPIERGERRGVAGSALFGGDGACLALARATWVSLAGRRPA